MKEVKRKEEVMQVTEDNTMTSGDILEEFNLEELEQIDERHKNQIVKKQSNRQLQNKRKGGRGLEIISLTLKDIMIIDKVLEEFTNKNESIYITKELINTLNELVYKEVSNL